MKSTKHARTAGHTRRGVLAGVAGLAGILASGRAPVFAQTTAKKLVFAHINPSPESAAVAFTWMAEEVNNRSNGALDMQSSGATLLTKALEFMNPAKPGNVPLESPSATS